jgi:hypothetical protein
MIQQKVSSQNQEVMNKLLFNKCKKWKKDFRKKYKNLWKILTSNKSKWEKKKSNLKAKIKK